MTMTSAELLGILQEKIAELTLDADLSASVLFDLTGANPAQWHGIIQNGKAVLKAGMLENPDISIIASLETAIGLFEKKINPMMAFLTGKVKVKGDMSKVNMLKQLLTGRRK